MCGRYQVSTEDSNARIREIIDEINRRYKDSPAHEKMKTGEVRPTDIAPVIANSKEHEVLPCLMKWGFSGFGDQKRPIINARSETAFERPMFRKPLLEHRCLIPAANYYEWEKQGSKKIKNAIYTDSPLLYMAGMYRYEEGEDLPLYTILTREAAPQVRHIHDRMPVIVPNALTADWLKPDADVSGIIAEAVQDVMYRAV